MAQHYELLFYNGYIIILKIKRTITIASSLLTSKMCQVSFFRYS